MNDLTAARGQMSLSLAFHMIFAALGIGLPLLMLLAEGLGLRRKQPEYMELARKWGKATGLLFAIGAVSGTALSFELGLLWPRYSELSGGVIGIAFALEGYAFFIEAIFLGLYLYGWNRLSPLQHRLCGIPVALSGALSGILVLSANAWMQSPTGFRLEDGRAVDVDPVAALFNPGWFVMALHSTLSTYIATAFAVAGVYAWGMLRGRRDAYHRRALGLAMAVGTVCALAMPLSGDLNARWTAEYQPSKLAAMEGLFHTQEGAPLTVGGWSDEESGEVRWAVRIPRALSLLAYHDPDARVAGLEEFPREDWPNVPIVRTSFQVMVGIGFGLIGLSLWYWAARRWPRLWGTPLLLALVASGFAGFTALEAGWIVTEVGRQPWIIWGVMRTADAVTTAEGVQTTFLAFTALYLGLAAALVGFLLRLRGRTRVDEPADAAERAEGGRRDHLAPA